jgi:hypothetical protein
MPFPVGEEKLYPDGLIRVARGAKGWTALVEVKIGSNELAVEQLETSLDSPAGRASTRSSPSPMRSPRWPGEHPTRVDKCRLRGVALHHLSGPRCWPRR